MQHVIKQCAAILLFSIVNTGLLAQEVIPTSGGSATGSGGSASYTVGQVVYKTNNGTNGSLAQGVQQPYEISVVIGIEDAKGISLECSVYPNPTRNQLILKIEDYSYRTLRYQIYDMNGKLLLSNELNSAQTEIPVTSLSSATYLLKVIDVSQEIKTFRIIKR